MLYIIYRCYHLIYEDDTVLIASSQSSLQKLMTACNEYVINHNLVFNIKKTKCMMICPIHFKKLTFPELYIDDRPIIAVAEEKYLGYCIRSDCSDESAMVNAIKRKYVKQKFQTL